MDTRQQQYERARAKILGNTRDSRGIGTLSEKTVHAILKHFYEPREEFQEVPVEGMVADIFTGEEIIEIQTRSFDRLRRKLDVLLPLYPVTVVYPIPFRKWIVWIDEATGELSDRRKSPKTGSAYDAFRELYKIKPYLKQEHLKIRLLLLDMEEYRLLNGWSRDKKRGSHRFDRIPGDFVEEMEFCQPRDYLQLVPYGLKEPFTIRDFATEAGIRKETAGQVLHILAWLGIIEKTGRQGKAYLYRVHPDMNR